MIEGLDETTASHYVGDVEVPEEVVQVVVEYFLELQELLVEEVEELVEVLVVAVVQGVPMQQAELVVATVAIGLQQKPRNQI